MKLINNLSRRTLFLACMLAGSSFLYAQSERIAFSGEEIPVLKEAKQLDKFFKAYRLYQIDSRMLTSRIQGKDGEINLMLNLGEQHQLNLPIEINPLIDPNGVLRVMTENGEEVLPPGEQITYQGSSLQGLQNDIRLTITDGLIYGYITLDDKKLYIEPARDLIKDVAQDIYVVYEPADVLSDPSITCGYIEQKKHTDESTERKNPGEETFAPATCRIADLAYAADYSMVSKFGSVTAAKNHIVSIYNIVEPIYTYDLNVDFNLVQQYVSSCSTCDPAAWTSTTDPYVLLPNFAGWGPTGFSATHDLASLWTDRNFTGSTVGLAYVGALCGASRYNVDQDYTTSAASLKVLWAHEMGHNFGANHDASGSWVMNGTISASNTSFSTTSVSAISTHMSSVSCLTTCTAKPELIVENQSVSPTVPPYVVAGTTLSSTARVKNYGRGTAGASTLRYYLSSNDTYGSGDTYLDQASIVSLTPGSSHTVSKSLTIPVGTTMGTWYVIFRADAILVVSEANEDNNASPSTAITVIGIPPLRQARPEATEISLDCYPNPVTDRLTISYEALSENTELVIRNVQGQEISRQALEGALGTAEVPMEALSPGVYLIYLMSGDEVLKVQKVIKQ